MRKFLVSMVLLMLITVGAVAKATPQILWDDTLTGQYAGQAVSLRMVVGDVDDERMAVWIEGKYGYEYEIMKFDNLSFNDYLTGEKTAGLRKWMPGEAYDVIVMLYNDGSFGMTTIMDYTLVSADGDVDELVQGYKQACDDIGCKSILRSPQKFEGKRTYCKFEGVVIQEIATNAYKEYLLDTGIDDGYLIFRYDFGKNEDRILVSDHIVVYGYIPSKRVTVTYDTLFGHNTVPYMVGEHWDLID